MTCKYCGKDKTVPTKVARLWYCKVCKCYVTEPKVREVGK